MFLTDAVADPQLTTKTAAAIMLIPKSRDRTAKGPCEGSENQVIACSLALTPINCSHSF
jgi:hypothetical protein